MDLSDRRIVKRTYILLKSPAVISITITKSKFLYKQYLTVEIKVTLALKACFANDKVRKRAKIRYRYNQAPHPTQDTNGKVTMSQLDITNESQEVSPFPAGDHKAHINRRAQRHSKHKTEQKHKRSTKEVPPWNGQ